MSRPTHPHTPPPCELRPCVFVCVRLSQRRYGIGAGGQASPGPAMYSIPQRSDLSFGGRIRSANALLQKQETAQRRVLAVAEDPRTDIARGLRTLRQRAMSAASNRSRRRSLSAASSEAGGGEEEEGEADGEEDWGLAFTSPFRGKPPPSPFRLPMARPTSAPVSPSKLAVGKSLGRSGSKVAATAATRNNGGGTGSGAGVRRHRRPASAQLSPARSRLLSYQAQDTPGGGSLVRRRPASSTARKSPIMPVSPGGETGARDDDDDDDDDDSDELAAYYEDDFDGVDDDDDDDGGGDVDEAGRAEIMERPTPQASPVPKQPPKKSRRQRLAEANALAQAAALKAQTLADKARDLAKL